MHVEVALPTPSSRTALWSLLTPVLLAADAMGLVQCPAGVLERVADVLDGVAEECRPSSESFVNPAKILAVGLGETVPIVLGDGPLTGVAAARAASMLARTARVPGHLRRTAGCRVPGRRLPRRAVRLGPDRGAGGAPRGDDIFADPFLDAPPAPGSACSPCATPTSTPEQVALADAVVESAREAGVTVWEQQARSGAADRAARVARGAHRLRGHLPRARPGARPVGLAARHRAQGPHLLT